MQIIDLKKELKALYQPSAKEVSEVVVPAMNFLMVDGQGVWLCVRRLHRGRFHWPRSTDATCALSAEQFAWLVAGVDWMRLSQRNEDLARLL